MKIKYIQNILELLQIENNFFNIKWINFPNGSLLTKSMEIFLSIIIFIVKIKIPIKIK